MSNGHTCSQVQRLLRIESEASTLRRKYCARDETIRHALLEIGGEVASVGSNITEALAKLEQRIDDVVKRINAPKRRSRG